MKRYNIKFVAYTMGSNEPMVEDEHGEWMESADVLYMLDKALRLPTLEKVIDYITDEMNKKE